MSATLEEHSAHPDSMDEPTGSLTERMRHLEGEVAELRHTLSELAEIVVGDIRDRRDAAIAVNAPVPDLAIPASLVPGGETTLKAVNALRRPWLLVDLVRDLGSTVRMYMDSRYRVRRSTQLTVPLIFLLFAANYVLFNYTLLDIPIFKHIFERVVEVILAVLLYKVVMREVARYRQMLAGMTLSAHARLVPVSLLHNDHETAAVTRLETH